ncbi:ABC transporter substrate-binding protein [Microbacterium marinilacus]|uniref:SsuA/THI5-like domain-containing protein n=1 Tax=Microbacterium marinilacus TaxID=415209 RepID=A0ABP7BTN7_9MICO|nr:ABC transporter substrate-binding protein [Microbacterium marinilacus]MBY0688230.1 ABC transporter substrate-binding protein [Microbacterium marinilacus]
MSMKHPHRFLRAGLVAAVLPAALVLASCGGGAEGADQEEGPVTVRVATSVSNSFPFIAIQAMDALGTFDDTDLEVEVIEATTPTIAQVMAGGEADIALASGNTMASSIDLGLDATIAASNLSYWDQKIIARPGFDAVEDLEGANFGVTGAGSPGEYSVVKLAESMGWEDGDYSVTAIGDLSSLTAALTAGQIDAFAWNSQVAFRMEEEGTGVIVGDAADYVGDNVQQAFAVMNDFGDAHPAAVREFFEAYFAEVEALQADPQPFVDVLVDEWSVPESVAERVAEETLPRLSSDGVITDSELAGLKENAEYTLGDGETIDEVAYTLWSELYQ